MEAQANSLLSPITAAADRLESTTMLVAKVTVGPGPVIKFSNFNWQVELQVSSYWLFHRDRDNDSDSEQTRT